MNVRAVLGLAAWQVIADKHRFVSVWPDGSSDCLTGEDCLQGWHTLGTGLKSEFWGSMQNRVPTPRNTGASTQLFGASTLLKRCRFPFLFATRIEHPVLTA